MKYQQFIMAFIIVLLIIGLFGLIGEPYYKTSPNKEIQGTIMVVYPHYKFVDINYSSLDKREKNTFQYNGLNILKIYSYSSEKPIIANIKLIDSLEGSCTLLNH